MRTPVIEWVVKYRMTRYRVRFYHYANDPCYMVERKKWYNLFWHRCGGREHDLFQTVELAKKAIPDYDRSGSAYWVGTMVDLTAERLGVTKDG
jgi:hypothetical protein